MKKDIREVAYSELRQFVVDAGEKPFKAKQIGEWLWQKGLSSFDEMTNLSLPLRTALQTAFFFPEFRVAEVLEAKDKTRKYRFEMDDHLSVEGVLIPAGDRVTACISSQVGCALGCSFCATSKLEKRRDLSAGEIFSQVLTLQQNSLETYGKGLSNIVLMGMGEPFLNYDAVMKALKHITAPDGLGFSPRRITLSTAGLVKGIERFTREGLRYHLAISLHCVDEAKRSALMPVNKSNSLAALREALSQYAQTSGERIIIEYLMLGGYNDAVADAEKLAVFCRAFPVKVNLIAYNPVAELPFRASAEDAVSKFVAVLESKNMLVQLRRSRGQDIQAACGQLAGKRG